MPDKGDASYRKHNIRDAHSQVTYIGFDYGTKRIGVAVGQTITYSATPLPIVCNRKSGQPNWHEITRLVKKWQPDGFVVGIPLNMDGTIGSVTPLARDFATQLNHRFDLPVHEVDERLTTVEAKQRLFEAGGYKALKDSAVDSVAAQLILESWLRTCANL